MLRGTATHSESFVLHLSPVKISKISASKSELLTNQSKGSGLKLQMSVETTGDEYIRVGIVQEMSA